MADEELAFLKRLHPFLQKSRAVQRLLNVYRPLVASTPSDRAAELRDNHRRVLILSGILYAFADIAYRIFSALVRASSTAASPSRPNRASAGRTRPIHERLRPRRKRRARRTLAPPVTLPAQRRRRRRTRLPPAGPPGGALLLPNWPPLGRRAPPPGRCRRDRSDRAGCGVAGGGRRSISPPCGRSSGTNRDCNAATHSPARSARILLWRSDVAPDRMPDVKSITWYENATTPFA